MTGKPQTVVGWAVKMKADRLAREAAEALTDAERVDILTAAVRELRDRNNGRPGFRDSIVQEICRNTLKRTARAPTKQSRTDDTLAAMIAKATSGPPMTAEEMAAQAQSFATANLALDKMGRPE